MPPCLMLAALLAGAGPAVKVGKLSAAAPDGWVAEKTPNRLRSHQFKLPSDDPAYAAAEVAVFPESPADPAKMFPRWRGSFEIPDGTKPDDFGAAGKLSVGPATVHTLDLVGTWNYQDRPVKPTVKEQRPDWRVVWAIVAQDDESTHVRLAGPRAVVEKWKPGFDAWLKSLK